MLETPIPLDLLNYSRGLFAPEDPTLTMLTKEAHSNGMPVDWEISTDIGKLFQLLCRAVGARKVLEFGAFAGHSALWFARSLPPEGKVISMEINPDYAAFARENLAHAGVGEKVEIRVGGCLESLLELERDAPFDVIFLDADKAHYPEFLDWSVRVLRTGGLLLADNVLRSGSWNGQTLLDPASDDPRILAIRLFNERLANHPKFTSLIVPMRAGVAVGLFHG